MYKNICIAVMLLLFLISFQKSWAGWDSSNFSPNGRKFQPVPTGHTPGKDNGPGTGTHNLGEDCGICHKPGGKAGNKVFSMSGTLYEDRAGRRPLAGGEVILQDINGKIISMTSNGAGNFWTYTAIGSNPHAVNDSSPVFRLYTYPSDIDRTVISKYPNNNAAYPATWQYKAWVKNGEHILPMVTIAPVGGYTLVNGVPDTTSRMSCSMHHAPMGSRGALWAGTKSTLPSYPSSGLSYKQHILPILRNKCVPCHIPGNTMTRRVTKSDIDGSGTRIDYSNNLDLTLYAGSNVPTTDGTNGAKRGVNDVLNKLLTTTLISNNTPLPTHAGGGFWTATDPDYKAIQQWIVDGAPNN